MTVDDLTAAAPIQETARPTPSPVGRPRPRRPLLQGPDRVVLALLLVLAAASLVVVRTTAEMFRPRVPSTYVVADAGSGWLQAAAPGSTTWFRRDLFLRARPVAASLTVDATDDLVAWVNGRSEAARGSDPRDTAELAATADVAPDLRAGDNSLLVQVSKVGAGSGRLWAALVLTFGDGSRQVITPASTGWQATTDAAVAGARLGARPTAARPAGLPAPAAWPAAVPAGAPRIARSAVPPPVVDLPRVGTAAAAAGGSVTFSVPTGPATSDAWLRLSASARASIGLDGKVVADLPAPAHVGPRSDRPGVLTVVHLGRLAGGARLGVRLAGSGSPSLYADLVVPDGNGWVVHGIPPADLTAAGAGGPSRVTEVDVTAAWPNGWRVDGQPLTAPAPGILGRELVLAGVCALLVALVALGAGRLRRIGPRRALTSAVVGSSPAVAAAAACLAWQRWGSHLPGSGRLGWALAITALWFLGVAACTFGLPALPLRGRRVTALLRPRLLICATALAGGGWVLSGVGRGPLWQDEATSLQVARDIDAHGLPRLGSDLVYAKAELYHALLAVLIRIDDDVAFLRGISVLWFVGSVLVFGLVLMPVLAPGRPWLHVAASVAFAVLPQERTWADQLRMYQQMQFFSILLLAFLLRALSTRRPRDVRWAAALLLLTYFSHEESFVLLPGVAVLLVLRWRAVGAVKRSFALSFGPACLVIDVQYVIAQVHPPIFGIDLSNRPYVGLDLDQVTYYYDTVFFAPIATAASLAVLSTVAVAGVVAAVRRRDRVVSGAGVVLLVSALTASLFFTAKDPRYAFVLLPPLVALAALGAASLHAAAVRWLRRAAGSDGRRSGRTGVRRGARVAGTATVALLCAATAATTVMSGGQLARPGSVHPDYAVTVAYLDAHRAPGDVTVTLSPPVMTAQYAGVAPDRVVQTGANKLLYVTLKGGTAVETVLGVPVLLTGDDVRRYVSSHARVWLVSDTGSYLAGVPADVRSAITARFHVVFESGSTTLSVAGYAT